MPDFTHRTPTAQRRGHQRTCYRIASQALHMSPQTKPI